MFLAKVFDLYLIIYCKLKNSATVVVIVALINRPAVTRRAKNESDQKLKALL